MILEIEGGAAGYVNGVCGIKMLLFATCAKNVSRGLLNLTGNFYFQAKGHFVTCKSHIIEVNCNRAGSNSL